jgi:hypothetical protein
MAAAERPHPDVADINRRSVRCETATGPFGPRLCAVEDSLAMIPPRSPQKSHYDGFDEDTPIPLRLQYVALWQHRRRKKTRATTDGPKSFAP